MYVIPCIYVYTREKNTRKHMEALHKRKRERQKKKKSRHTHLCLSERGERYHTQQLLIHPYTYVYPYIRTCVYSSIPIFSCVMHACLLKRSRLCLLYVGNRDMIKLSTEQRKHKMKIDGSSYRQGR